MEHRCSPRYVTDVRAEVFTAEGQQSVARIRNASILGHFLAGSCDGLRLYQEVKLTFVASDAYQLSGRIVRIEDNGFAVELEHKTAKEYHDARAFVEDIKAAKVSDESATAESGRAAVAAARAASSESARGSSKSRALR